MLIYTIIKTVKYVSHISFPQGASQAGYIKINWKKVNDKIDDVKEGDDYILLFIYNIVLSSILEIFFIIFCFMFGFIFSFLWHSH